ncbi:MAG: hypothetical protein IKO58_02330, partial [Prevotella sp.]|nr:hypothetical protein [Prevotella sp.]
MSCRVTILQTNIKWAAPDANQKALESALLGSEKSDLYVLPEMWNTGFMAGQESFFTLHSSLFTLKELAQRFNAAISGSMAVREDDKLYNRFYFVTPTDIYYYDKRHLFSYAGEDKSFTAGEERTIVEWRGVRFLLQVCYDLRFPCFSRNRITPSQPSRGRENGHSSLFTL